MAEEQHLQLDAHAHPSSMDSESEAEEQERVRPKTEKASAEVANISQQHAALLREAGFNTVPGTVNVRRGAAAQTPSITLLEEGQLASLKIWWTSCHKYLILQLQVVKGSGSWNLCLRHPHKWWGQYSSQDRDVLCRT